MRLGGAIGFRFRDCAGSRSCPNIAHVAPEGTPHPQGSQARDRNSVLNLVKIATWARTLHNYRKVQGKFRAGGERCLAIQGPQQGQGSAVGRNTSLALGAIPCHAPPLLDELEPVHFSDFRCPSRTC
jgi:hypothetical protein